MYVKNNIPCIVLGVKRAVKAVRGLVPDLEELIIREDKRKNMHTKKLKDDILKHNSLQMKISENVCWEFR